MPKETVICWFVFCALSFFFTWKAKHWQSSCHNLKNHGIIHGATMKLYVSFSHLKEDGEFDYWFQIFSVWARRACILLNAVNLWWNILFIFQDIVDLLWNGWKIRLYLLSAEEKRLFALLIWFIFVRCFLCIFHLATKILRNYSSCCIAPVSWRIAPKGKSGIWEWFLWLRSLLFREALSLSYGQV